MLNPKYLAILLYLCSLNLAAQNPPDSIYQLDSQWRDQDGSVRTLGSFAGKKQVVSLIYTHCLHTCPTIVSTMQAIEHELPTAERQNVGFMLVSLTPDSDTPAVMKDFAKKRQLDLNNWVLLTGTESDVRGLAMVLNIKYQSTPSNEVNHSNLITVLDDAGRILFQEVGVISNANKVVKKISQY